MVTKIALIGSFKQHYNLVLEAFNTFQIAGLEILSPKGTAILEHGIPFVRFTSDPRDLDDAMIQTLTLQRILNADLTYVVCPNGYVGRTTCYEIGRLIQAVHPLYFSSIPQDLPIRIPASHILSASELAARFQRGNFDLEPLYSDGRDEYSRLELSLIHRG